MGHGNLGIFAAYDMGQCSTVQYCTVLYSTVQYSTVVDRHGDQGRHVLRHVRGGRIGALPSQGGNLNYDMSGGAE